MFRILPYFACVLEVGGGGDGLRFVLLCVGAGSWRGMAGEWDRDVVGHPRLQSGALQPTIYSSKPPCGRDVKGR